MAKIGIACGGTGGHLYPGLAVAEALSSMGHAVRLYISTKEIDRKILSDYPQFQGVVLPTIGWTGFSPRVLKFCKKFWDAYRLSNREVREQKLDAVLGMGGFTSAPLIVSASRRGIPTFLHESNAIPGKVTRLLSKQVKEVFVGFNECARHLSNVETKYTGTPVRSTLHKIEREKAAEYWKLDPEKFTIGIIGGSQGARGLNRMVIQAMVEWRHLQDQVQLIHLTGPTEGDLLVANYQRNGLHAVVRPYCNEMENLYSITDLLIARSGAASLTEIGHFGLPSILVPYPAAAEDHQTRNARIFTKAGAALMVKEGKNAEKQLAQEVMQLHGNTAERARMSIKAATLTVKNAAHRVAEEVQRAL
ncbi:MAG: UDP-N-acetylglucosamine--N-acetylmuramyl-(pentapeptide) pyrophosphoryl-undecaprenol N-acetylglucosamine transferase [Verrucomicrobiales bacterium]|jgi:UDP-N-acetylglucosamine--N-acetylmuramyl-(pentapeptide) pyrophosphoryl-undecaprenol N-acetylglucosamine transferase|nr:UDP-N-acetylglucosamine--N-acetylmuramyl-(pentapeptide) pyrophosphoryl-undecaprenol N-acetylglucosamine transferase [Verrucomicrobiales bacterium]